MKKLVFLSSLTTYYLLLTTSAYALAPAPAAQNLREKIRNQVASPSPALVAKLSGPISAIGTSSLTVNNLAVNISSATILVRKFGGKSALSEFSVGDEVHVLGKWTDENKTAIDAKIVRNLSVQKRHGVFLGNVSAVFANGFTLTTVSRGAQTANVSATTKYVDRKNQTLTLSNIAVGHKVMIKGLWDSKLNTVSQITIVRDYSLPATASGMKVF
jgi:hypothetical protein